MNFIAFGVNDTNIFPMANTRAGGQLVTEYNLRAKESLDTPETIDYLVGPSYTHSEHDFYVQLAGGSSPSSSSILEITPGRASVNGYFIQSNAFVNIDMIQLAHDAIEAGQTPLMGDLTIGLRTIFSTEPTISGSIAVENDSAMYEGIQIVVLPKDETVLPADSPMDQTRVNMYLKLADFTFINGNVSNIINNYPEKCQYIPANRIADIDGIISTDYVKRTGINPKRLYVLSGKSNDPEETGDTWCDATDSLMVWGSSIPQYVHEEPQYKVAQFDTSGDSLFLAVPHKQIDGMKDSSGNRQYFRNEMLSLPKASFEKETPGVIGAEYTKKMKDLVNRVNRWKSITRTRGLQRAYIAELHDRNDLPTINPNWIPGDYILVAQDFTVETSGDGMSAPSTMYSIVPNTVRSIFWNETYQYVDAYAGIELDRIVVPDTESPDPPLHLPADEPAYQTAYWNLPSYDGVVRKNGNSGISGLGDYFVYEHIENAGEENEFHRLYIYGVTSADPIRYSDPLLLNGGIPLAQQGVIGGFYNVDIASLDQGYVYLDTDGHLRLLDYDLLRSGAAAYQLGEDFTVPAGLDLNGIQEVLDEFVNQRVAFPNATQMQTDHPNLINIYIDMTSLEGEDGFLNIYDIDSRFGAAVVLHLIGEIPSTVAVVITNCEKIMIDSSVTGNPTINLHNSCLYYDSDVLNIMNDITDLRLWYEKFSPDDPDLVVEGLTVKQVATSGQYTVQDYASSEYWSESDPNDNHFTVALQSITFGADGIMSGCGVFVRNATTSNVEAGSFIITDEFTMPIGPGLMYPTSRITKQIKVTGQFVSAYTSQQPEGYMVSETSFSLVTPTYSNGGLTPIPGNIAFLVKSYLIPSPDPKTIDVWDPGTFHYFEGVTAL